MNEEQRRALWGAADCCATCLGGVVKRYVDEETRRLRQMIYEIGFCPDDGDAMPCRTCGAGL